MGTVPGIARPTVRAKALRNAAPPAERILWQYLSNRRLAGFKFSRQMPVGPYICEFLCRSARLVVEFDGLSHDIRRDHDAARDAFLQAQGFIVLRFTNDDALARTEGVVFEIERALTALPNPSRLREGRVRP